MNMIAASKNNRSVSVVIQFDLNVTEEVSSLMREAVALARKERIQDVSALRSRLQGIHPGKESAIDDALALWRAAI